MNVTWAVQELYPGDAWVEKTEPARIEKAQLLQNERKRRGHVVDLFSCLQFSDKLRMLIKEAPHRELLHIASRREGERLIKRLEALRNNMAHAQPIVDENWDAIRTVSKDIEHIVSAKRVRALIRGTRKDRAPRKEALRQAVERAMATTPRDLSSSEARESLRDGRCQPADAKLTFEPRYRSLGVCRR